MILAIDTTSEQGSLALAEGDGILEEVVLTAPEGFGHILIQEIDAVLKRHNVRPADLDCLAAATGPGSFTGVRIGLAAIKGLAHALNKPVVGVSNLQALATLGDARIRAVQIDARRGEIYGAVYDADLNLLQPEVVMKEEAWLKNLPPEAEIIATPKPLAAAIARIAQQRFAAGEATDPAELEANYVRRSDAELFWKDARPAS